MFLPTMTSTHTHIHTQRTHVTSKTLSVPEPVHIIWVTWGSDGWIVAVSSVTRGLLSLGGPASAGNSSAGTARHTSGAPLSNQLWWSHWVTATAVTTLRFCFFLRHQGSVSCLLSLHLLCEESVSLKIAQFSV